MYGEDEEEEDEEEEDGTVQFMPPKYLPGSPSLTPTPTISSSTQKVLQNNFIISNDHFID
jgi:hypothetical protein